MGLIENIKFQISLIDEEIERYQKRVELLENKVYATPITDYFKVREEGIKWINENHVLEFPKSKATSKEHLAKLNWYAKEEKRLKELAEIPIDSLAICTEISGIKERLNSLHTQKYEYNQRLENLLKSEN